MVVVVVRGRGRRMDSQTFCKLNSPLPGPVRARLTACPFKLLACAERGDQPITHVICTAAPWAAHTRAHLHTPSLHRVACYLPICGPLLQATKSSDEAFVYAQ